MRQDGFSRLLDRLFGGWLFRPFNRMFDRASHGYVGMVRRILRGSAVALLVYVGLVGLGYMGFATTPTGFVPQQDKQYRSPSPSCRTPLPWTAPRT